MVATRISAGFRHLKVLNDPVEWLGALVLTSVKVPLHIYSKLSASSADTFFLDSIDDMFMLNVSSFRKHLSLMFAGPDKRYRWQGFGGVCQPSPVSPVSQSPDRRGSSQTGSFTDRVQTARQAGSRQTGSRQTGGATEAFIRPRTVNIRTAPDRNALFSCLV